MKPPTLRTFWRRTRWAAISLAALVAALYIWSAWRSVIWAFPSGLGIGVSPGQVWMGRESPGHPEFVITPSHGGLRWWFQVERGSHWFFGVPMWLVLAAPAALAALAWRAARPLPGRCAKCDYNLAGLPPSAPCPECGRSPAP